MYILSAEYGLVNAHKIIEPYDRVLDKQRAQDLVASTAKKLQRYDYVVFFKGGARKVYFSYIYAACNEAGKTLVTLGFANMGGIKDLPIVIELLRLGKLNKVSKIGHARIFFSKSDLHPD